MSIKYNIPVFSPVPKDASSNSLPCSAIILHWEQPCAKSVFPRTKTAKKRIRVVHFFMLQIYQIYQSYLLKGEKKSLNVGIIDSMIKRIPPNSINFVEVVKLNVWNIWYSFSRFYFFLAVIQHRALLHREIWIVFWFFTRTVSVY